MGDWAQETALAGAEAAKAGAEAARAVLDAWDNTDITAAEFFRFTVLISELREATK